MPSSAPDSASARAKSLLRPTVIRAAVAATRLARWMRGRPAPIPADPALAIVGLFETASGIGMAARGLHHVLAGRSPQLISLSELSRTPRVPDHSHDVLAAGAPGACLTDVAIHAYNPDVFLAAMRRCGMRFLTAARVNVALAIWETETLPPLWPDILSLYDVICTHSRFSAAAFERATGRRVAVIPPYVPVKPIRRRGAGDGVFEFLCMFDHRSDIDRKNPVGSIIAFRDAWLRLPAGTPTRLRIKCHAGTPAAVIETLRVAAGAAPIEIVADTLDDTGMDALWQRCDCLLSLHRSEGFGLPVAEALSRGIPVIATRQGGVLDFVDDTGCFLVPGPAAAAGPRSGAYPEWTGWVEPDLARATRHVIDVIADYAAATKIAASGRTSVSEKLSARQVERRFDAAVGRRATGGPFPDGP